MRRESWASGRAHVSSNKTIYTPDYSWFLRPAMPLPWRPRPFQCLAIPASLTHCPPWTPGRPVIGNQCSSSVPEPSWPRSIQTDGRLPFHLSSLSQRSARAARNEVCSLGQTLSSSLLTGFLYYSSANASPQWQCCGPLMASPRGLPAGFSSSRRRCVEIKQVPSSLRNRSSCGVNLAQLCTASLLDYNGATSHLSLKEAKYSAKRLEIGTIWTFFDIFTTPWLTRHRFYYISVAVAIVVYYTCNLGVRTRKVYK